MRVRGGVRAARPGAHARARRHVLLVLLAAVPRHGAERDDEGSAPLRAGARGDRRPGARCSRRRHGRVRRVAPERERAWPYAVGDARRWADNLHTAYLLECLLAYARWTGDTSFDATTRRGYAYYRSRFFTADSEAKYFDDRVFPIDATACAQSIIALCRFGDADLARRVAATTIALLQRPDGAFGYQVRRLVTVRTPFARWSTAWMLAALALLADATPAAREDSAVAP